MSIRARVEDALLLWHHGGLEGTLLSALVAVAATARCVHPSRSVGDRKAFEQFLDRGVFQRFSVEFRGNCRPVYSVFYKWFRNELVHKVACRSTSRSCRI